MTNWQNISLGDALTLQRGFDLPAQNRRAGRVPIVSSSGVSDYHSDAMVKGPGVVTGRYGTIGQVFLIKEDFWPLNTTLWVKDFHGNDPHFASYLLRTVDFQSCSDKSSVPGVNRNDLHRIPVLLPPLAEQKAIAAVLGALDDKIELNRRMNATLEAMARALFQSWFVDFDPVRAKLDGRKPAGFDAAATALFPSTFDETAAGHIPHGWRIGSIYEIANVIYGAPFASSLFNSEKLGKPLIRIRDLPNESPAVFTTEMHPKGYLLQPGDIAVGMDGEFRAYLWAGVESWLNQRVCVFAPKPGYSAAFVRNSIIAPLAEVEATETATTVIHLGKNDIDRFKAVIPPPAIHEVFAKICQPWYDQIVANKQQSRTLANLREALLPKLLSGEVRAPVTD